MGLIGRLADQGVDARFAEGRRFSAGRIEINELRGGVVIEQVFVVGRGEEVLESWRGTRVAGALAHMRTYGDGGLDRNGAAAGGNRTDDQRAIVAQPLERRASGLESISDLNTVDAEAGDASRLAGGWRSDP